MLGDLTVVTGNMFSGKSSRLIELGKGFEELGAKVAFCRPELDNRYSEDEVVSHDGEKVKAYTLPNYYVLLDVKTWLPLMQADVILIDEGQFFGEGLLRNVAHLLEKGKTVIVAGLDLDYKGRPFTTMSRLMAEADEVIKLHAECARCGSEARFSMKIEDSEKRLEVGGSDKYKPLCRNCFKEVFEK